MRLSIDLVKARSVYRHQLHVLELTRNLHSQTLTRDQLDIVFVGDRLSAGRRIRRADLPTMGNFPSSLVDFIQAGQLSYTLG